MFIKLILVFFFVFQIFSSTISAPGDDSGFIYNGFKDTTNLILNGTASFMPNGLLMLADASHYKYGHAFYLHPFQFKKNSSSNNSSTTISFSTHFVFGIRPSNVTLFSQGLAFFIAPQRDLPSAMAFQYLGLFNTTSNGSPSNHVVAVEIDTMYDQEYDSILGPHVGIDINSLNSVVSQRPMYFDGTGFKNLTLNKKPVQVWVDYDGAQKQLNVTLAPIDVLVKPAVALLTWSQDLSPIMVDSMYLGFSASTRTLPTVHYILGWSFKINGEAQPLNLSSLPELPETNPPIPPPPPSSPNKRDLVLKIGLPIIVSFVIVFIIFIIKRKRKFEELKEDWELVYGTHRFSYKHLYKATKGFAEKNVIGQGAFGKVYHGILPGATSKTEVAIKKVSHDSTQGMQQFISEIVSVGKLRHRNVVKLLGYCRRKGELLLVYDFMPNGSLDKFIFQPLTSLILSWSQRFKIIKDVGSGLLHLHEGCEQVVIHRDIKAGNVLLDGEMNGSLGDFGLAILFNHGTDDAATSRIVGTPGYLAPEMTRVGSASTKTDVFAFGAFLLEVACGRRPIELITMDESEEAQVLTYLVDWVLTCWRNGTILQTSDSNLGSDEYVVEEMELVLKLGLLCSHTDPLARPTMRQVMQYLNGDVALLSSDLWILDTSETINQAFTRSQHMGDLYPCLVDDTETRYQSPDNDSV